MTPLHWACHHGSTEGIKLLLDAGADPANKDGTGTNCLHKCVQEGCLKYVSAWYVLCVHV